MSLLSIIKSIKQKIKLSRYRKEFNFNYDDSVIFGSTFKIKGCKGATINVGKGSVIYGTITCENSDAEINIGERSFINKKSEIICYKKVDIGDDVVIAWGVTLFDNNAHSFDWKERRKDIEVFVEDYINKNATTSKDWNTVKNAPIIICDKVWIGFGVSILKGVTIGEGAIVGAQSVVRKNVEPYTVICGNPAIKVSDVKRD